MFSLPKNRFGQRQEQNMIDHFISAVGAARTLERDALKEGNARYRVGQTKAGKPQIP